MVLILDGNSTIKEQSLLFDLLKTFNWIESRKNLIFVSEITIFLHACATYYELPPIITTMPLIVTKSAVLEMRLKNISSIKKE